MRRGLWLLLLLGFGVAWGQGAPLEALLVLEEEVIEEGRLVAYTGVQRYPVASEAELKALLKRLARPPRPPRFVYQEGRWRGVEKKGLAFDEALALEAYRESLAQGKRNFRLPVRYTPPSPSLRDLYALGVREHLATGETDFRGSSRERAHNLLLASAKLDGLLLPPGAFSFNRALGPITEEEGYKEAFVIVGERTEQGVGGGVCQVSTTLFRAFFFAGLPILERHAHSYQVAYYKPPGLDAAVIQPYKDLKALNDTPGHILVQRSVVGTKLRFHLFGTKDREVAWEGPFLSERKPPLPPKEIPDPSLPPGVRKQVDFAAEGARVEVRRRVRYADGRVREDRLVSVYRPWGAVYRVGPSPTPKAPPAPPAGGGGAP
ncbi:MULTISPECIES: VanW family protein [Thermus]|jgi:vancomycin resistance protein YoaR|uniref:Vancomycin B-type resistance protein VanW n=1 Tax=Thermus brockianus TaxID=56956 RepID=A0A1J0LTS5_THEBO|nr:VanW family protein [Thermus brockianus]APD09514.1 Vancomycin B-type resistance protein VanW [Thermus brockianus]